MESIKIYLQKKIFCISIEILHFDYNHSVYVNGIEPLFQLQCEHLQYPYRKVVTDAELHIPIHRQSNQDYKSLG